MKTTITSADVAAFILEKLAGLRAFAPEYISIECGARQFQDHPPMVFFKSYCSCANHSPEVDTAEEAIEWIAGKIAGRRESDVRREEGEKLLQEAAALERLGR